MKVRVDWRASLALVGTVVKWLSVPLVAPPVVALYYGDGGIAAFGATIVVAFTAGWPSNPSATQRRCAPERGS